MQNAFAVFGISGRLQLICLRVLMAYQLVAKEVGRIMSWLNASWAGVTDKICMMMTRLACNWAIESSISASLSDMPWPLRFWQMTLSRLSINPMSDQLLTHTLRTFNLQRLVRSGCIGQCGAAFMPSTSSWVALTHRSGRILPILTSSFGSLSAIVIINWDISLTLDSWQLLSLMTSIRQYSISCMQLGKITATLSPWPKPRSCRVLWSCLVRSILGVSSCSLISIYEILRRHAQSWCCHWSFAKCFNSGTMQQTILPMLHISGTSVWG